MTTKDKTGDQLVASIRKSKTGAVSRKTGTRRTASSTATKASSSRAKSRAAKAVSKTEETTASNIGYSVGRRVWPD